MSGKRRTARDIFNRLGWKHIIPYILVPIIFLCIVFANFSMMVKLATENTNNLGTIEMSEYSAVFKGFLQDGVRCIDSAADNIERMLADGDDFETLKGFFVREMNSLDENIADKTEGLYGLIDGNFIDGIGWIPDDDYEPKERPWYKEAIAAKGVIVYVAPYIDSRTGNITMTIAKLLDDGESVLAMDFNMNDLQRETEALMKANSDCRVGIIDEDGTIVTHSENAELGKNYFNGDSESKKSFAETIISGNKSRFGYSTSKGDFIVFSEAMGGGWFAFSIVESNRILKSIVLFILVDLLVGIIGIVIIFSVLLNISSKRLDAEDFNVNLGAMSSVYYAIYKVHLKSDTFEVISCVSEKMNEMVGTGPDNARNVMLSSIEESVDDRSKEEVLEFVDYWTLPDRMKECNSLTIEFLANTGRWARGRFIVAERDEEGNLETILWLVEIIDEERRMREKLLYLSETDRMTGINNRGSGESKIRKLLMDSVGGMFLLLDVDKFKSINDKFGHAVGDKVIISIGKCMRNTFRGNDISMRLGGDEFAVFAPGIYSKAGGENVIKRFLKSVDEINIPELEGRKIEVSVGVSFYGPDDDYSFEVLYKRADDCTYKSKEVKGNHVTYYEGV